MQNLTLSWQSAGVVGATAFAASVLVRRSGRPAAALVLRETATVLGLFAVWQFAGQLSVMGTDGAMARGQWLWDMERRLGLPNEYSMQQWVLPHPLLVQGANYYYAVMHFGAMTTLLAWVFLRHRHAYPWVRTTLVLVTAASLIVQLIPVAPPRLLAGTGLVDTGVQYGQSVYGETIGGLQADSYSAMPSVHVAWCVLVAVAVIRTSPSRWRWLVLVHPVLTVAVVLLTANHFWLDGVAAVALLLLSYLAQWVFARVLVRRRLRRAAEPAAVTDETEPISVQV
ncbi:phosphatase PAP2 family protein [Streptacidiphilus sp. MAP12-16]|uniref:phosphatase PAP2 family protein n=1 Tax=Streptacidiphilus sp. MAP12-16 TaxID=3156300 RepID=UPI003512E474